jgi:hypothetical protein
MKRNFFGALLLLSCLLLTTHAVQAQCGGKAEPSRIEFKRGTHSSTLKGKLRGDEQAEYILGARKGQRVTVNVAAVPADAIAFELLTPLGEEFDLTSSGTTWTGVLPESGDYMLYVRMAGTQTPRASYTLTLSIK